jgi:hypothetical protein
VAVNELQRQSYLKTLGLTPWVARVPLPGAAPTPWAEWPELVEPVTADVAATDVVTSLPTNNVTESEPSTAVAAAITPPLATPASPLTPAPSNGERDQTSAAVRSVPAAMRMTLQAHQVGSMWLLAEQEDAQAPDLGREAQQLMNNMLAIFPGERRGPRRFIWPISDIAMDDEALRKTFQSFTRALGGRILLCAKQTSVEKMLGQPRYQPCGDKPVILPVSALSEMLENPAEHKRLTWQAMLAADFHA